MLRRIRSSWWHRPLTAFFAVWFVLSATDMAGMHPCPMHGGAASANHAMDMAGMESHSGMASAGIATAGQHAHPADANGNDSEHAPGAHTCTCVGVCCPSANLQAPDATTLGFVTEITDTTRVAVAYQATVARAWIDFMLPYATAPPIAALN